MNQESIGILFQITLNVRLTQSDALLRMMYSLLFRTTPYWTRLMKEDSMKGERIRYFVEGECIRIKKTGES